MMNPLDAAVADVVNRQFAGAVIDSVTVTPDEDSDGDPILDITVVFSSDMQDIEGHKLVSIVRHLRPRLIELNDNRFPMFRFISKRDSDRLKNAAA